MCPPLYVLWHVVPRWQKVPASSHPGTIWNVDAEQPSLRERRRLSTRLEIARAAAELFTAQGATATTAEEIATAGGVSLRTFYRHFRTKEEAVAPLLEVGAEQWQAALRAGIAGMGAGKGADPGPVIARAIAAMLAPGDDGGEQLGWVRGLLVAARADPALAEVWSTVNSRSEAALKHLMAGLMPSADPFTLRLYAAAATAAIRLAFESWADDDAAPGAGDGTLADGSLTDGAGVARLAGDAFARLSQGLAKPPAPAARD